MMRLQLSEMARYCNGHLQGADVQVHGMIHDARRVEAEQLFCALPGVHHDGHAFVAQARQAGAAAALVARPVNDELPQLVVGDVEQAMGQIAAAWRAQLKVVVVGITGSNGKTTVKEMLAAILARCGSTLATRGNYNNELGVPLTLARLDESHRFAVIEMGASAPGDIASLARLAQPEIALVTNAGPAHLEGFGDVEGVARAKGELFAALPDSGVAIINADDAWAPLWRSLAGERRSISFGLRPGASVSGHLVRGHARVNTPAGDFEFNLRLPGEHNFANALAATAAALALDTPLADIAAGLTSLHSLPGRLHLHAHPEGWQVIDDSYNANPASLKAALEVLASTHARQRWLVLGDMGELGPNAAALHEAMGQAAREAGVDRLFTIGPLAAHAAAGFGESSGKSQAFERMDALEATLRESLEDGVVLLVKGSRSAGLDALVQRLLPEVIAC